jgi:polyferredoxin
VLVTASAFTYRPWCRFLCPFGFVGWIVEQWSLLCPRINRQECRECLLCTEACPSGAMTDIYNEKAFRADCFACGACLEACPHEKALGWRLHSEIVN